MPLTVLIVDDDERFRELVKRLLGPGVRVVGEAARGDDAVLLATEVRPDVVLMDLEIPGLGRDGRAGQGALRPSPHRAPRAVGPQGIPGLRQLPTTTAGRGARDRTFRAAAALQGGTLPGQAALGAGSRFGPTVPRGTGPRRGVSEEAAPRPGGARLEWRKDGGPHAHEPLRGVPVATGAREGPPALRRGPRDRIVHRVPAVRGERSRVGSPDECATS